MHCNQGGRRLRKAFVVLVTVAYWSESRGKEQLMSISVYFEMLYWELAQSVLLLSVKDLYGNRSIKKNEMKCDVAHFQEISK